MKWKTDRGWDKVYWAIDIHDMILKGNYSKELELSYYPDCLGTLRMLSKDKENVLILYSSTWRKQINKVWAELGKEGILFNYINENPEVKNTEICEFSKKFYFNILVDDKVGFDPKEDWRKIYEYYKDSDKNIPEEGK